MVSTTNVSMEPYGLQDTLNSVDYFVNWTDEKWMQEIHDYIKLTYIHIIFIILYVCVFVSGLVGNFLVCFAVWRNQHLRTVTNYFLVNLACADFMVIFVCMPLTLTQDLTQSWFLGLAMCKIVLFLQTVSVLVSVLTLTAISLERYMAICHPLSFHGLKSKYILLIIFLWIVSIGSAFPELIFLTLFPDEFVPVHINWLISCRPRDEYEEFIYQIFLTLMFYCIPLVTIGFAYIRIAHCLWRSTTASQIINYEMPGKNSLALRNRKRTAKMLIAIVVLFFACYLPVYVFNVLRYTKTLDKIENIDVITVFALGSRWLCYFNSAVNPLVYNFMSEKFKKEFRVACFCFKRKWIPLQRNRRHIYHEDPLEYPRRSRKTNLKKFSKSKDKYSETRTETLKQTFSKPRHTLPFRDG